MKIYENTKYYETWNLSRNLWYTPPKFFANSEFTPESHDAWKMIRLIVRGYDKLPGGY